MAFSGASVKFASNYTSSGIPEEELPWDTEVFDAGGWWAVSPNPERLTVPSGIAYAKSAGTVRFQDLGTGLALYSRIRHRDSGGSLASDLIHENAFRVANGSIRSFSYGTPWVPVSAGDYFTISAYTGDNTGTSRNIQSSSSGFGVIGKTSHSGVVVYRSSDVSLGAFSTLRTVTWNAELYDTHGAWAVSPNPDRLTVPSGFTAARLSFMGKATTNNTVRDFSVRIYKNGADLSPLCETFGHGQATSGGLVDTNALQCRTPRLSVTSGDYFTAHVEGDAALTSILTGAWFEMELFA